MSVIRACDLTFEYVYRDDDNNVEGIKVAVDNVTFSIEAGQFVAILGHNGSGKSTLAKHMNALLKPTEGKMYVNDIDTTDTEKELEIRRNTGMVFQNPDNQIIGVVVEEDVAFGPENMGVPTKEIIKRVEESLKAVGMYEFREYSPNKLSGGQKQRVAIAGTLAMRPNCIVLDEPTAMLDPSGRKEVLEALHKLNKEENITIILITHFMEETIDADKIYVMDNGKIVMEGAPREIFSQVEKMKEYSLDVPQVTQLAYELRKEGIPLPNGILKIDELVNELCRLSQIK